MESPAGRSAAWCGEQSGPIRCRVDSPWRHLRSRNRPAGAGGEQRGRGVACEAFRFQETVAARNLDKFTDVWGA
eukprot:3284091-Prymnesium_polylepis.1